MNCPTSTGFPKHYKTPYKQRILLVPKMGHKNLTKIITAVEEKLRKCVSVPKVGLIKCGFSKIQQNY
jgi:hypothetical protein